MGWWIYFIMFDIFQIDLPTVRSLREKKRGFLKAAPGPAHHPAQSGKEEGCSQQTDAAAQLCQTDKGFSRYYNINACI
jgi:hypothetical protein